MARPRIPVGSHGNIRTTLVAPKKWTADTRVRDSDGRFREVKRFGPSKQAALTNLQKALDERPGFGGGDLTGETLLSEVADRWLAGIEHQVATGDRAPNTPRVYRSVLALHVKPALGQLQIREATVTRCDTFLRVMRTHNRAAVTKTTRTVLNGILGYATRHGLIDRNPMRDVGRIRGDERKQAKALTEVERDLWLEKMEADVVAVRHDLPDLTRFMLATGCRIGEALAVAWESVDFDDKTVAVDWTIVRLERGGGLARTSTKTAAGRRTLNLPAWAVDMLRDRYDNSPGTGPVFPNTTQARGWRDPSNTLRTLREARTRAGFGWVTSHVFRKTVATTLHDAGLTPREIADQLGHANLRTLDPYIGRRAVGRAAAAALEVGWSESAE